MYAFYVTTVCCISWISSCCYCYVMSGLKEKQKKNKENCYEKLKFIFLLFHLLRGWIYYFRILLLMDSFLIDFYEMWRHYSHPNPIYRSIYFITVLIKKHNKKFCSIHCKWEKTLFNRLFLPNFIYMDCDCIITTLDLIEMYIGEILWEIYFSTFVLKF